VTRRPRSPANDYRQSLNSYSSSGAALDPDSFTFATVTSDGHTVALPEHGVSLTIPEGAVDPGFAEEVFLAVMPDGGRDRPRLSDNQTLLSPVVLAGPPRLLFKKPVVISFGHCANLKSSSNDWELGVYHCDSLFAGGGGDGDGDASDVEDDTPWVKLVTVGQEGSSASSSSVVAASLDLDSAHVMTDFLSRFCIVGQSAMDSNSFASKVLKVVVFGKSVSFGLDFCLCVHVVEDTASALERCSREAEKKGLELLERPKQLYFQDGGSDLQVNVSECATGWSLKPKTQQTVPFRQIWSGVSGGGVLSANFTLRHIDPTVKSIAFKLSAFQSGHPETCLTFAVSADASINSGGGCIDLLSDGVAVKGMASGFRLPPVLRQRLCVMLDSPQTTGQNDWRALAAGLRLERFSAFFSLRPSPTECVVTLWEVQRGADPGCVEDLLRLLRVIGRDDCADMIEHHWV
jgi:netrin receptor unc-5